MAIGVTSPPATAQPETSLDYAGGALLRIGQLRTGTLTARRLAEQAHSGVIERHRATALVSSVGLIGLFLLTGLALPERRTPSTSGAVPDQHVYCGIDPNTARWFELAQLPGLGRSRAQRIEMFRRRQSKGEEARLPVFQHTLDLCRIQGIGAKTAARLHPFLHFATDPRRD